MPSFMLRKPAGTTTAAFPASFNAHKTCCIKHRYIGIASFFFLGISGTPSIKREHVLHLSSISFLVNEKSVLKGGFDTM